MKKTYLALAFLITGFLLAGNAYGEDEVYYCAETDSNGFRYDEERGSYVRAGFNSGRFKINLDRVSNLLELTELGPRYRSSRFPCMNLDLLHPEEISCSKNNHHFNFNTNTGLFVYAHAFGYVGGDGDSLSISYGTCDKF